MGKKVKKINISKMKYLNMKLNISMEKNGMGKYIIKKQMKFLK